MTTTEAEREIAKELAPGERIVWRGVPRQGIFLVPADWFLMPFSLLWAGFVVYWMVLAIRQGAPLVALFGVPFVFFAYFFVFGRFQVDGAMRDRAAYAVTDRRVIMVSTFLGRSARSTLIRTLTGVTIDELGDGSGTITFGWKPPLAAYLHYNRPWPGPSGYERSAFDLIPSAREVFKLIRRLQDGARWPDPNKTMGANL